MRSLCRRFLEREGYTVLEAGHAAEALHLGQGHGGPIHLLVTDVVMPEMGGRELASRLLALHPETRVLYVSGYTEDALLRHGMREGEVTFLQKPFTPDSLARKVREVLDAPAR